MIQLMCTLMCMFDVYIDVYVDVYVWCVYWCVCWCVCLHVIEPHSFLLYNIKGEYTKFVIRGQLLRASTSKVLLTFLD